MMIVGGLLEHVSSVKICILSEKNKHKKWLISRIITGRIIHNSFVNRPLFPTFF